MDIEEARIQCLAYPQVVESFPFDEVTLVLKVGGRMFALIPLDAEEPRIALKCDPEEAERLREHYQGIEGAWHMNKRHWNSILLDSDVPSSLIEQLICHSYSLVVRGLTRKARAELGLEEWNDTYPRK